MAKSATGVDPFTHFSTVYDDVEIPGFGDVPPYRPVKFWRVHTRGFEPLDLPADEVSGLSLEDAISLSMKRPLN